jgi:hypothetical protein
MQHRIHPLNQMLTILSLDLFVLLRETPLQVRVLRFEAKAEIDVAVAMC